MYWEHFVLNSARTDGSWTETKIFTGGKTRTRIIAPGDVTGDNLPDILSVDSGGTLWIYPGKGNGTFGSRFSVRTGWNQYNSVRGQGDLTGTAGPTCSPATVQHRRPVPVPVPVQGHRQVRLRGLLLADQGAQRLDRLRRLRRGRRNERRREGRLPGPHLRRHPADHRHEFRSVDVLHRGGTRTRCKANSLSWELAICRPSQGSLGRASAFRGSRS
ncbi:hypothetical protein AB0L59_02975 [Streptomyces sp. NPDC052109]|uniref:hypothetical protein n=1 Tax=Streptomyces sp. NPDC052109 TaxID=3155527 RepID=UPI00342886A3